MKSLLPLTLLLLLALPGLTPTSANAEPTPDEVLDTWLTKQASFKTWSADVTQTRKLKSLVRPLVSEGKVYFRQPNQFRWVLGDPPKTLAVRMDDALVIVYPRLKQAERYAYGDVADESLRQALALLDVGFPNDVTTFREQYDLLSATKAENDRWSIELRPKSKEAQRIIGTIRLEVGGEDYLLFVTEVAFPDGSTMTNTFSGHELNPELDDALFSVELDDSYEMVDPLKKQ